MSEFPTIPALYDLRRVASSTTTATATTTTATAVTTNLRTLLSSLVASFRVIPSEHYPRNQLVFPLLPSATCLTEPSNLLQHSPHPHSRATGHTQFLRRRRAVYLTQYPFCNSAKFNITGLLAIIFLLQRAVEIATREESQQVKHEPLFISH